MRAYRAAATAGKEKIMAMTRDFYQYDYTMMMDDERFLADVFSYEIMRRHKLRGDCH